MLQLGKSKSGYRLIAAAMAELDTSAAREIRGFIRKFLKKNSA